MSASDYHLEELAIASRPDDPRRVMPPISPAHRRILDVGCGAGQTLLASNLDAGVRAVGVDVEQAALSLGRTLSRHIRFVRARGEALPFAEESFDLVICRVALPYMNVARATAEMWRVLTVGGGLWVVLHPFAMARRELAANLSRLNAKGVLYQLYVLTNGLSLHLFGRQFPSPLDGRYESFQTSRGITRALSAAGFEEVEIRRGDFFVVTARKKPAP